MLIAVPIVPVSACIRFSPRMVRAAIGALLLVLVLSTNAFAEEADFSGLHFYVEQDLFLRLFNKRSDQNYTMGFGIKATGSWFRNVGYPHHLVDQLLTSAIPSVRLTPNNNDEAIFHSLMLVGSAFTPDDIEKTEPVKGDRPYASLLGLVTSRTWVDGTKQHAVTTELGVGILGLDLAQHIQTKIHELIPGADKPSGWHNQVSDGGELTGLYRVGLRRCITLSCVAGQKYSDASVDADISLGYYTNASLGTTVRFGSFYSPYFGFISNPIGAVNKIRNSSAQSNGEFFVFGAVRGRGVLYNALLQGAIKEFDATLSTSEISRFILELELGLHALVPVGVDQSLYVTWVALAGRSPEFYTSYSSRWHWWGAIHLGFIHSP